MAFKERGKTEYEFQENQGIEEYAANKQEMNAMKENRK
jgi:hypothetical protein